jgi:hypothetical protein
MEGAFYERYTPRNFVPVLVARRIPLVASSKLIFSAHLRHNILLDMAYDNDNSHALSHANYGGDIIRANLTLITEPLAS